jgi:predicted permease
MLSDLLFRARALLRRREVDAELDEELHAHIDAQALKYERVGFSREEARRLANIEFGGLEQIRADCRDARGVTLVETVAHDLRYAWRVLRKDASFTVIAALTLALGIGASTTVFSVVNAILLKPLPYPDVDRVVFPWRVPPPSFNVGADEIPWGRVDFLAFAGDTRAFESIGAFLGEAFNLTGAGEAARFDGARVSEGFFPSLGVAPQLGRMFRAEEDRPGHELEVILSDRLWRERFNADPTVVGRTSNLNGSPYTIVGVMPPGFAFPHSAGMPGSFTLPRQTLLWAPLALSRGGRVRGEPSELAVLGRLAPGFTRDGAQAELDLFARRMDREFPQGKGWFNSRVTPMTRQLAGETRRPLLLLLGAVAVLLLIACSNVANLLLTRSIARTREFTVRAALGAGRTRLIRQLTTESLLLAAVGGLGGLAVAYAGVVFARAFGPSNVPRLAEVRIDPSVLLFAMAVSLLSGILFGLAPAWAAARGQLVSSLKDGGLRAGQGARGSRLRSALLVIQVSLALVLVIASGLLVRTFAHLVSADGGFNPDRVLTFELTLPPSSYASLDRIVAVYRTVLQKLDSLPGVESAGIGETVPMGGAGESTGLRIPDRADARELTPPFANYTIVSPRYLPAVGTPILRGRDFLETDSADAPPVAIVNAAMARKYWPGQDVIGKEVGLPIKSFNMTVVGLVADVKHLSLREEPGPEIYVPYTQKPWPSMLTMHVAVRTKAAPTAMIDSIRAAIRTVDPDLPIASVSTLETIVDDAMAQPRFSMLLVGGFGALALVLACVGLYGAVSYSVTSRTQEIGVRLALGAPRRRVFALVLSQCVRLTSLGIAIGIAMALVVLKAMTGFLYGIEATDPATFASLSVLLLAVAMLACYVPARRAARVDPIVAMRAE